MVVSGDVPVDSIRMSSALSMIVMLDPPISDLKFNTTPSLSRNTSPVPAPTFAPVLSSPVPATNSFQADPLNTYFLTE